MRMTTFFARSIFVLVLPVIMRATGHASPTDHELGPPPIDAVYATTVKLARHQWTFTSGLSLQPDGAVDGKGTQKTNADTTCATGFLVGDDGTLATTYRVVKRCTEMVAEFEDGSTYTIDTLLAYDPMSDLAVVKLSSKNSLPFVKLASSGTARVRQRVYAAGNTMCGGISVSDGTVNRLFLGDAGKLKLIQHSAASAPGSQGGPIFVGDEVVGIQCESHREYEIHYAVPVDRLKSLLEKRHPQHLGDVFPESDEQIDKRLVHMFSLSGLIAPADEEGPGRDSHHTDLPWPGMDLKITAEADGMQDIALWVVRPTEYGPDPLGAADEHEVGGETLYISADDFYRDDPQYLVIHVLNLSTAPVKYGLSLYWIRW